MLLSQGNLRDQPLVDLTLPLLFVHGSKDSMCKAVPFAAVKARMSSIDLQVSLMALLPGFDDHAERQTNHDSLVQCLHDGVDVHKTANSISIRFLLVSFGVRSCHASCAKEQASKHVLSQVHEVEGGDHGLAVHAGKQSKPHTQHALKQVSAAICEFACMLEQNLVAELSLDGSQQQNTKSHHKQTHAVADSSSLGQEPPAKRNKLKM